jgi:hypothetical protein
MSGWDLIPRLESGERMCTTVPLCTEIYEALYERTSAVNSWIYDFPPIHYPAPAPLDRGDLAGVAGFQYNFMEIIQGSALRPVAWAVEAEVAGWTDDYPICDRLKYAGASTPASYLHKGTLNIFEAAFGEPWLTWHHTLFHIDPDWSSPLALGRDVIWAQYLSDFYATLNLMTLLVLLDSTGVWQCYDTVWGHGTDTPGTWAAIRATEWLYEHNWGWHDRGGVGRYGTGVHRADGKKAFQGYAIPSLKISLNTSGLANAKHADASPLQVTRYILYFQYRGSLTTDGPPFNRVEDCAFGVWLQSNFLGEYTAIAGVAEWVGVKIDTTGLSINPQNPLELEFKVSHPPTDDTPGWADPGVGNTSYYATRAYIRNVSLMVEFDWEYKAA